MTNKCEDGNEECRNCYLSFKCLVEAHNELGSNNPLVQTTLNSDWFKNKPLTGVCGVLAAEAQALQAGPTPIRRGCVRNGVIDVDNLTPECGFVLVKGARPTPGGDRSSFGGDVASAGDFNGDNWLDLALVEAEFEDQNQTPLIYITFVTKDLFSNLVTDMDINKQKGTRATALKGKPSTTFIDLDGDSFSDLIYTNDESKSVYIIFGLKDWSITGFNIAEYNGRSSKLTTSEGTFGKVYATGDFYKNGVQDLAIRLGNIFKIIFGKTGFAQTLSVNPLGTKDGLTLISSLGRELSKIAPIGDLSGDRVGEIVVVSSLSKESGNTYALHIVFGQNMGATDTAFPGTDPNGNLDVDSASLQGFTLEGLPGVITEVLSPGDLDKNGVPDLVVGMGGENIVYVMLMSDDLSTNPRIGKIFELTNLGINSPIKKLYKLVDGDAEYLGNVVSAADLNGDKDIDLIIGENKPIVRVVLGPINSDSDEIDLQSLDAEKLLKIKSSIEGFGVSIASVGDLDKDGHDETVIGCGGVAVGIYGWE